jgi:hypothetical protein
MPIEIGIWRIDKEVKRISFIPMPGENKLEELLVKDISIVDPSLLLIGRQVITKYGKFIDLLAIDADGRLVVIELKRDKTPREVVAQLLDYGAWVRTLRSEDIAAIYSSFMGAKQTGKTSSLDEVFCTHFSVKDMPEELNAEHKLVIIASELDDSTERIVTYLAEEYGVAINVVFFRFFKDGDGEYLSRAWLIDPGEAETKLEEKRGEEAWNGEYYVSFGESETRRWVDARQHGYVCAGGGNWYSKTLNLLSPGDRIWVNVPGRGYVGVGKVLDTSKPITEFEVTDTSGKSVPITSVLKTLPDPNKPIEDLEYFVKVDWIKTVPIEHAIKETGFFGNQNSVAKPKDKKWGHTVSRLKEQWSIKS